MEHSSSNLCEIAITSCKNPHDNLLRVNLGFIVNNKSCNYHVFCVLISILIGSFCTITCRVVVLETRQLLDFTISCRLWNNLQLPVSYPCTFYYRNKGWEEICTIYIEVRCSLSPFRCLAWESVPWIIASHAVFQKWSSAWPFYYFLFLQYEK